MSCHGILWLNDFAVCSSRFVNEYVCSSNAISHALKSYVCTYVHVFFRRVNLMDYELLLLKYLSYSRGLVTRIEYRLHGA